MSVMHALEEAAGVVLGTARVPAQVAKSITEYVVHSPEARSSLEYLRDLLAHTGGDGWNSSSAGKISPDVFRVLRAIQAETQRLYTWAGGMVHIGDHDFRRPLSSVAPWDLGRQIGGLSRAAQGWVRDCVRINWRICHTCNPLQKPLAELAPTNPTNDGISSDIQTADLMTYTLNFLWHVHKMASDSLRNLEERSGIYADEFHTATAALEKAAWEAAELAVVIAAASLYLHQALQTTR